MSLRDLTRCRLHERGQGSGYSSFQRNNAQMEQIDQNENPLIIGQHGRQSVFMILNLNVALAFKNVSKRPQQHITNSQRVCLCPTIPHGCRPIPFQCAQVRASRLYAFGPEIFLLPITSNLLLIPISCSRIVSPAELGGIGPNTRVLITPDRL